MTFIILGNLIMLVGGIMLCASVFSAIYSHGRDVDKSFLLIGIGAVILGAALAVHVGGMPVETLFNPF